MIDNEIMKVLECCKDGGNRCDECPYGIDDCLTDNDESILLKDVLDLINRKDAEIERLQKIIVGFMDEVGTWSNKYEVDVSTIYKLPLLAKENLNIRNKIKAEAIKEFAERLKEKGHIPIEKWSTTKEKAVYESDIDNLIKEMVGEQNE